jgi:hypothetical protein
MYDHGRIADKNYHSVNFNNRSGSLPSMREHYVCHYPFQKRRICLKSGSDLSRKILLLFMGFTGMDSSKSASLSGKLAFFSSTKFAGCSYLDDNIATTI